MIINIQKEVNELVAEEKDAIFRKAFESSTSHEVQTLVYGKAGVSLSLKLHEFIKATNAFLSWDVTDPHDPRNHYRQCPHCDAVYAKIGGCENMICGDWGHVPSPMNPQKPGQKAAATNHLK
ncbi:hypothetical protein ACA910_005492 [Epithemia clementina (nom. ined.)]